MPKSWTLQLIAHHKTKDQNPKELRSMQSMVIEDTNPDNRGTGTVVKVKILTTNGKTRDAIPITIATSPSLKFWGKANLTKSMTTKPVTVSSTQSKSQNSSKLPSSASCSKTYTKMYMKSNNNTKQTTLLQPSRTD